MNKIRLSLAKVTGKSPYLNAVLIAVAIFLGSVVVVTAGMVVSRMSKTVMAAICSDCGGEIGGGGITPAGGGGSTATPGTGGTSSPPSSSGMAITFNRSCDTFSGGVCVFVMTPGQELAIHEVLSNYSINFANASGWPISGVTDYTDPQSPNGYTFNVNYEAGADFSCKPSPGTAQFPSLYSPDNTGNNTCMHDFRGTSTPATSSADYYLRNNNSQPGDYHFQVINVRGMDTWGADFFSFIIRIPNPIVVVPSYNFTCDTASLQKDPGQTATYTLRATSVNGFTGQVNVAATGGLPAGAVAGTATINVPANSSGTAPLTITTDPATPPGTYNLTFTGSSPGLSSKSCSAQLTINDIGQIYGPTVTLTASTTSVANSTQSFSLTWTPANASSCDASAASLSGAPVNNPGWVNGSSKDPSPTPHTQNGLTISATTVFSIHCHKAGFPDADKDVTVAFSPTYSFNVKPDTMSFSATKGDLTPPSAKNFTITNNSTVSLTFSVSSSKTWLNLTPGGVNSVTVPANGGTATVTAQPNTTAVLSPNPDTASVTFNSNSPAGSTTKPATYTLNSAPSFTMDCININPNTKQTKIRGETASWTIPVTGRDGFNKTVALSITDNYPANLVNKVDANLAFTGNPNPENKSGDVRLVTGATTQTGSFNAMKVTASAPGETSQQCTLPSLVVNSYSMKVEPNSFSFSAVQGDPVPPAKDFLVTNTSTAAVNLYVSKSEDATWYTMNGSSAKTLGPIFLAANGGTFTVSIRPTSTATTGSFADYHLVFDAGSFAGVQINTVFYDVSPPGGSGPGGPVDVTAKCGDSAAGYQGGSFKSSASPGAGVSCDLPSSGSKGFITWTSSGSNDGLCSVLVNTAGDSMTSTSPAANPSTPAITSALNNPPGAHSFTVNCTSPTIGVSPGSDTITFNVPSGGTPNFDQSKKNIVCVTSNGVKVRFANFFSGDCPGAPASLTSLDSYLFKSGDIVTFIMQLKNTGNGALDMNGRTITLTDTLSNLVRPSVPSSWNVSYACGGGCTEGDAAAGSGYVDQSPYPPVIKFRFSGKAGSSIPATNGVWSVVYDAQVQTPPAPAQAPFRFFNSATAVIVPDPGVTIPTLSLDNPFLFVSNGSGTPDRHEIAP